MMKDRETVSNGAPAHFLEAAVKCVADAFQEVLPDV
jgi:hypothetical protein